MCFSNRGNTTAEGFGSAGVEDGGREIEGGERIGKNVEGIEVALWKVMEVNED